LGEKARSVLTGKLKVLMNIHKDDKVFTREKKETKAKPKTSTKTRAKRTTKKTGIDDPNNDVK